MRHNKHIIRLPILPKLTLVILLPQLLDQLIQSLCHILRALAAFAPIFPYVPVRPQSAFLAVSFYLRGYAAFVVAIVPFPDGFCYFDCGVCADVGRVRF